MKWFNNTTTRGLKKKTVMVVIIIAIVAVLTMFVPYYAKYTIPHIWTYLNISQISFDQVSAVMGYVVLALQLPSGWLADKFSGRKLLLIAIFMSTILTTLFGLACMGIFQGATSLVMIYVIFSGFGVAITLFLWSPIWKLLSDQGTTEDQGALFGLQGAYTGFLGFVLLGGIGVTATYFANRGDNTLIYILIFIVAGGTFFSGLAVLFFVKENNQKSALALKARKLKDRVKAKYKEVSTKGLIKETLKPLLSLRVWLIAIFVLGMYMFQSVLPYYMNSYLSLFLTSAFVTALSVIRSYGLRMAVSGRFGAWLDKKQSFILVMVICIALSIVIAIVFTFAPGIGDSANTLSSTHKLLLQIVLPILYLLLGMFSWFFTVGRYSQLHEVPHTKANFGTTMAVVSLVAFSSDAWFYQMASGWMKAGGHVKIIDGVESYDQAGVQLLLLVATSIGFIGMLSGLTVYIWNKKEMKRLGKTSFWWRIEEEGKEKSKELMSTQRRKKL